MTINGIRGYIACAAAKSVVGIGTPDICKDAWPRLRFFYALSTVTFAIYGGACGGVVRLAGSLQPVVPTLYVSPPDDWNLTVVINQTVKVMIMTALAIQPISFSFHETHDVRIHIIGGEPWFCLKDVCDILSVSVASPSRFQMDMEGVTKIVIPTDGGRQQLTFVNEPNLYRVIFRSNKQEAKQFQDWVFNDVLPTIRKTGRYQKQPPSEPLNSNDMSNLKRLVWMMTGNMRYENAWNAGVWYALRSATGRPSPQPFSVEDLPALGEECRRIMKITAAVHSAVTDFEKEVIRKVVRRRGEIEPVLNEMRIKMLELHEQESQGILMLDKLSEHSVNSLINRN